MYRIRGFTLIEMLIVIVILAILAAVALPAMSSYALRQRVSSQANELMLALSFARAEAVKRNTDILVRPNTNTAEGWSTGWCVGPATMTNCTHADRLKVFSEQLEAIVSSDDYTGTPLTFRRDGTINISGTFKVTAARLDDTSLNSRCIQISLQGRPRIDKIKRDANC